MAEGRAKLSIGGYEEEFINAVEEDLQCSVCQLPLKDPILTKCGHRFCRQCLDEHFARLERNWKALICPVDRNKLMQDKDIFPDKATERKILSSMIKCLSKGCPWTGELRSKDNHLESYRLKLVSCSNKSCNVRMKRKILQEHVTTKCKWRIIVCSNCEEQHPECKTKAHQKQCRRFPVICPDGCGDFIARGEMSAHTKNDCLLAVISCPYAQMGCTQKVQRREVDSHLHSAMRRHLDLACVKLDSTQTQLNTAQEEFKETTRKLEEKFNKARRKLEEKVIALESRPMQCQEEHTWKISCFSEVLRRAKSGEKSIILSDAFVKYGYKFRLRMHPDGDGNVKNTHLSLYFVIIKGEYDAVLPWPFHKKVTFTLIDQREDPNSRKNIVKSYTADPELKTFARPVTDENGGLGYKKFVSHDQLKERHYMVEDTLFIQVKVTPPP